MSKLLRLMGVDALDDPGLNKGHAMRGDVRARCRIFVDALAQLGNVKDSLKRRGYEVDIFYSVRISQDLGSLQDHNQADSVLRSHILCVFYTLVSVFNTILHSTGSTLVFPNPNTCALCAVADDLNKPANRSSRVRVPYLQRAEPGICARRVLPITWVSAARVSVLLDPPDQFLFEKDALLADLV